MSKEPPTVYVAGKMRGLPEDNYPAFREAARRLALVGYKVLDPSRNLEGQSGLHISDYMAACLPQVAKANMISLLPGWETSEGTALELHVAKVCGVHVYLYRAVGKNDHVLEELK